MLDDRQSLAFYGQWSKARADRVSDDCWRLTGHAIGVPVGEDGQGREYRGPHARANCINAAMRVAFKGELPPAISPRSGDTQRGLQAVEIRKAV